MKQPHSFPNCPAHFVYCQKLDSGEGLGTYQAQKPLQNEEEEMWGDVVSSSSPEASGKGLPCVAVHQLNGKPFEGVAFRYHVVDGLLELLVTHAHPHTAVQLVGRESRRKQVAELIIPHCTQTNVL